jgi:hypothetical protein
LEVERFWIIEGLKPNATAGHVLGELAPEASPLELWGAQFTLLCDKEIQSNTDILAAISLLKDSDGQDALKRRPLLYAQRDAYTFCAGVHDLCHAVMLPRPFVLSTPVYVKSFCGNYTDVAGRYDVIVDVYFEGKARVVNHFPNVKGGF